MKLPIRKFANAISLLLLALAIYSLITKTNIVIFFGYTIFAAVVFLPRIIYRRLGLHENFSNELLDWIEISFSLIVLLSIAGYMWLFDSLYHYDTYVHFFTPLLLLVLVSILFKAGVEHYEIKTTKSDIVLASLVIVMSLILLWEVFEYFVSTYLNKNMFFNPAEPNDTLYDVVAGFMSLPVGAVIVYKYSDWFFDKFKK